MGVAQSLTRYLTHYPPIVSMPAVSGDTFEWVQKRGRNLTGDLEDDFCYHDVGSSGSDYSGR